MQLTSIKAAAHSKIEEAPWQGITETIFTNRPAGARDELALELCEGMIDITAALFNVSSKEIRKPGRSSLGVSRVRQVAMYVAHVILRLNMTDIGRRSDGIARRCSMPAIWSRTFVTTPTSTASSR